MKRLLVGALLAAVTASAPASDLSMRKLLEMAKANHGGAVLIVAEKGDSQTGVLTDIGQDVFCVKFDAMQGQDLRPEHCYPISGIARIYRAGSTDLDIPAMIQVVGGR